MSLSSTLVTGENPLLSRRSYLLLYLHKKAWADIGTQLAINPQHGKQRIKDLSGNFLRSEGEHLSTTLHLEKGRLEVFCPVQAISKWRRDHVEVVCKMVLCRCLKIWTQIFFFCWHR